MNNDMNFERELLLNELKEHTEDCDCARSQHFYEEEKCRKKSNIFKGVQSTVFLITIAMYVLIVSGIKQNDVLNFIGIILAMASTLLEILSHMLKYEDEAVEHWKSAQMYADLYRECQFFNSRYMDSSVEIWKEKLNDISEQLNKISMLSPSVSKKSYLNWAQHGYEKQYPVNKVINELKIDKITDVIEKIKRELEGKRIEIFLFGSYLSNMYYNDIDIAVIIHEDEDKLNLVEKMTSIEQDYSVRGLDLDITIITEADIRANRCTQFINNVCRGCCYYKSPAVSKSIMETSGVLFNYNEMVDYFIDKAKKHINDFPLFVSNAFYMYYHALSALLTKEEIPWYGEKSLIQECEQFASNNDCMPKYGIEGSELLILLQHVRMFFDEKETLYLSVKQIDVKPDDPDFQGLRKVFDGDEKLVKALLDHI